jgi:hypothetical protein
VEVFAVGKDGFETLIPRMQSKRNLSNFLQYYMPIESENFKQEEDFWWHKKTIKAREELKDRYKRFLDNYDEYYYDSSFMYEGIFDKKESLKKSGVYIKFEKSQVEISQLMQITNKCKFSYSTVF